MGAGSGVISTLTQALNCSSKCDCCQKLQQQINELNQRFNQYIPKAEKPSIITESVSSAQNLIVPIIGTTVAAAISPLSAAIAQALSAANGAAAAAAAAANIARAAAAAAASALAKLAGLAASIAAILAAIATLQILGARIDALEAAIDSLGNFISRLFSIVTPIKSQAQRAEGKADRALSRAMIPGAAGARGERGLQGVAGAAGARGERGLQGVAGAAGARGERGLQGVAGAAGARGEKGKFDMAELAGIMGVLGVIQSKITSIQGSVTGIQDGIKDSERKVTDTIKDRVSDSQRKVTDQVKKEAESIKSDTKTKVKQGICEEAKTGNCLDFAGLLSDVINKILLGYISTVVTGSAKIQTDLLYQILNLQKQCCKNSPDLTPYLKNIQYILDGVELDTENTLRIVSDLKPLSSTFKSLQGTTSNLQKITNNIQNITEGTRNTVNSIQNATNNIQNTTNITQATANNIRNITEGTRKTVNNIQNATNNIQNTTINIEGGNNDIQAVLSGLQTILDSIDDKTDGIILPESERITINVPVGLCVLQNNKWEFEPTTIQLEVLASESVKVQTEFQEMLKVNRVLCEFKNPLDHFPANVPQDLSDKDSGTLEITSLAQYLSYSVKQMDALVGQFPLEVEIEDADLTQEGEQKQKLTLPNLAEAVGEIMTMLLLLRSESDANLNATIRTLLESGQTKQIAQVTHDYVEATSTYLGYKGKLVEKPYPMMFTPGEEQLDKILKETTIKLRTWEYGDKEDLNDVLAPLIEHSAMWKAQNFRNLGATSPADKLREIFTGGLGLSKKLSDLNPDESDFDDFSRQVENGFITQPGVSDTINPYGRDASRKPRVREVGTDTSD